MHYIISLLLSSLFFTTNVHEFHLSKTIVKYKVEQQAIQVSMHLFIDDLEEALRQKGADSLFICTKMENPDTERYLTKYLEDQFKIISENGAIQMNFLGKEISESLDGVWVYMEATDINQPQETKIENSLLTEVFEDQKNIISIEVAGKSKHLMLTKYESSKTLQWK